MRSERRTIERHRGTAATESEDFVVVEAPLEIRLTGTPLAVIMRTPGDDEELATGFALTEGIILRPQELARALADGEGRVDLQLAEGVAVDPERFRRNLYATSSCGVCGKASIDAVRVAASRPGRVSVPPEVLVALPGRMREAQETFERTGGLHAAALFTEAGELLGVAEDVGRHNAVDKVIGATAGDRWPLTGIVLVVSGRQSFEIVQKAAVAGIGLVAGVSAPSTLAVDLASELGMTLIGFLRGDAWNRYA